MDPDPDLDADPIFVIDLQDAIKKLIKKKLFCLLLFEGTFTSFFKHKNPCYHQAKKVRKTLSPTVL
jgi:hypothetical protein